MVQRTTEIESRLEATYARVLDETRRNADGFVWTTIPSVEELGRVRMAAMRTFLDDFAARTREGRYVAAALPALPLAPANFDLVLCSHFLFLYSTHLSEDFHRTAILEMCRVAPEVRVFPLLALDGARSTHVAPVTKALGDSGYVVTIEKVQYEFQRGGNEMIRVRHRRA